MLNKTVLVPVTNFSSTIVGYRLPEMNISREFLPGETKSNISVGEIRALYYTPGGKTLIKDYLCVDNTELLEELGVSVEPEYFWTKEDIKNLLANESVDRLKDALEFAPAGIVKLIKDMAVATELNDMSKRQAIMDATGFNVSRAIENNKEDEDEDQPVVKSKRRVPVESN